MENQAPQTQPAQTEEEKKVSLAVQSMTEASKLASTLYPEMALSSQKAQLALSKFTVVNDDATDALLEKTLVAVRTTYDKIVEKRKKFTGPLDAFKVVAMMPEKAISTDANVKESAYNRAKKLRNDYANRKATAAAAAAKAIKDKQNHDNEVVRLNIAFDRAVFDGGIDALTALDAKLESFFKTVTLENYDASLAKLAYPAPIAEIVWAGWFETVTFNPVIELKEFGELKAAAKLKFTLNASNADYLPKATAKLTAFKERFPAQKLELQRIADLARINNEKAEEARQELALKNQQAAEQQATATAAAAIQAKTANETQLQEKQEDALQDNSFAAQVGLQSMETLEGMKDVNTATIIVDEELLVVTICDLFYQVFIHPKYKGIIKRKPDGTPKVDENGRPEYEDWLEKMLQFYADNCEPLIEGIEIKTTKATIQKAKK